MSHDDKTLIINTDVSERPVERIFNEEPTAPLPSGVTIVRPEKPKVEIIPSEKEDGLQVVRRKHVRQTVVEEIGEPKEPFKVGQKFMLNGYLFKLKKIAKRDIVLRLVLQGRP